MKIVKTEALPEIEYFQEEFSKNKIVLHHTVSAVGKYIDDWFKADKGKSKVATAYVLDKDGTIFELFDPKYWGWHTGMGIRKADQNSIAIELVNEGPLWMESSSFVDLTNPKAKWWIDKEHPKGRYAYKGEPYIHHESWRGYKNFAGYTKEQYTVLLELLDYLTNQFNIKRRMYTDFDYNPRLVNYKGVLMHCNLKEVKTDLSVAFDTRVIAAHFMDVPNPKPMDVVRTKFKMEKVAKKSEKQNSPD